jgi:hypothetical protein
MAYWLCYCAFCPQDEGSIRSSGNPCRNRRVRVHRCHTNRKQASWIITGIVRNNTGRDWKRVVFDFQLYDMTRSVLSSYIDSPITVIVYSLHNGEEQRFGTNYFKPHRTDVFQSVWKYEVMYKSPQTFVMVKPWENRELLFEDQAIRIIFSISEKQIGIRLQNKTQSPIKVDWNTLSYVDITGLAHGVVHTGVRYIERDRPQVPTIIPPAAMIEDVIIPSGHISYTSGTAGGWSSRLLFPGLIDKSVSAL